MKEIDGDDYIFPKILREKLSKSKFINVDIKESIHNPDFWNEMFDIVGLSDAEKKKMWEEIGREDLAQEIE